MAPSHVISEIFNDEKYRNLEIPVKVIENGITQKNTINQHNHKLSSVWALWR